MSDISSSTRIFPVIAWPVEQVKAPALFNAFFEQRGINARVVPMEVAPEDFPAAVRILMKAANIGGILISIPHKPVSVDLVDQPSQAAVLAGAANAIFRAADGQGLAGDLIDGEGFVRALDRTCVDAPFNWPQASALIVGAGGVGSAIAAALAARGIGRVTIHDTRTGQARSLCERLQLAFPATEIVLGEAVAGGHDLVVNSTPLGMHADDPLPVDLSGLSAATIVADCVMKIEMSKLLVEARRRGCRIQKGKEMLLEQAPLYLERFGWPGVTSDEFRALEAI